MTAAGNPKNFDKMKKGATIKFGIHRAQTRRV